MRIKKYISKELILAICLDIIILFFVLVITADLTDPFETQMTFGAAFILMIMIAVFAYRHHNLIKRL